MKDALWVAPSPGERKDALIGCNNVVKKSFKANFTPIQRQFFESEFFQPITIQAEADWLLNHDEDGQTYESFWRSFMLGGQSVEVGHRRPTRPQTVIGTRSSKSAITTPHKSKTICIVPLGSLPKTDECLGGKSFMVWLKSFCNMFFKKAKVVILPSMSVEETKCQYRVNQLTGKFQLRASDIITHLKKVKPSYAYCVIALTMIDLYPKPSWDFVYGLASSNDGVGLFSLARYDDIFYETWTQGKDVVRNNSDGSLDYSVFGNPILRLDGSSFQVCSKLLFRACKVMSHEICHMFGLKHCIWSACVMNGSNHLQESDRRPAFLCPVCLRKLQTILGFDLVKRYKSLRAWATEKFWEEFVYIEEKPQVQKSSKTGPSWARRSSLPDVTHSTVSSRKKQVKKIVASKPNLETIFASPPNQSESDKQKNAIKVAPPPLDSFSRFQQWLDDAITYLAEES
ncbi:archaemetzincin-2-like isoform X1 [Clavelina lepadiformis]|uniref:archaemetzincin-2-like isoform X1 n=1 Tax=Clavelina lepadiformis TaxID=159417 RepID=UPI0040429286